MAKSILTVLACVALAPATAQAAVDITVSPVARTTADGFSLPGLEAGVDHVLASVEEDGPGQAAIVAALTGDGSSGLGTPAARRAAATHGRSAYDGLAAASTDPVPEPATWLMMILGFFGLSFAVRRRGAVSGNRVRFS